MSRHGHIRLIFPVLLGLICLAALWRVILVIGLHVPLDPNEGWNAYHAAAAMGAGSLYPGPQTYMINNYPPLSFYVVGTLGALVGDNIIAGRIISLTAFLTILAGIYAAARRMGCSPSAAVFAPLFFAAGLLLFTDYVGMNDPQLLAHAIASAGFLLVLRDARSARTMATAAFAFVAALFVKHNVVAMAVASTLWLFFQDRRRGVQLFGFGAAFLLAGLILFYLIYGRSLLSVLITARLYSFDQLFSDTRNWLTWTALPLAGLVVLGVRRWKEAPVRLCALYALVAVVIGIGFLGGAGVDPNVLFDADIALGLSTALVLNELSGRWALVAAAALSAPFLYGVVTNPDWREADSWLRPLGNAAGTAGQDIAMMSARSGPALCEMQSFCYWAAKPPAVDVFNVGQQFDTGARSDAELVRQIESKRFAVIQFDPDSPYSLGEDVHDAMERSYRLDHEDDFGSFYVPR